MAISAEQLNIILTAKDREFARAMERNQRRVEMFARKSQKQLSNTSNSFRVLSAAAKRLAPVLAAAFSVQALSGSIRAATEVGNLATLAGVATDEFQILSATSGQFGISQGKLADILKDVNDKFGDFTQTGAGPLKDFFEFIAPQVGLTADAFADLSSDQKLGAYINALEKANVSQSEMTFYMEAIASDSTALVAAFKDNSAAIEEMRERAEKLGFVLDEDLIKRAAESKQELDLMSQAISVQLSSALVEMSSILVGAATAFAGFVTNIVAAIEAVQKFLNPTSNLEIAIDNVVMALGDEIRQSQQLEIQLGRSNAMSVDAARIKLNEAKSRRDNAIAIMSEARAQILGSKSYLDMNQQIADLQAGQRGLSPTMDGEALLSSRDLEEYERLAGHIVNVRKGQEELLSPNQETADQIARTSRNIQDLEDALRDAEGGIVTFGQSFVKPIESSEDLRRSFTRVTTEVDTMSNRVVDAFGEIALESDNLQGIMQKVESSFEDAFMTAITSSQSAGDQIKSVMRSILAEIIRVQVARPFARGITGLIGGMFGGGASPGIPARATGGSVQAGQPYITGENGRELFVPRQNGQILSASKTSSAMTRGASDIVVHQTINVSTGVQSTVRAEVLQMMPMISENAKAAVAEGVRRGGSYAGAFG